MLIMSCASKQIIRPLWAQVKAWYELALKTKFEGIDYSYDRRIEAGHHRREHRQVWTVPVSCMGPLHQVEQWVGLQTIVMVKRVRHLWNKTTVEVIFI